MQTPTETPSLPQQQPASTAADMPATPSTSQQQTSTPTSSTSRHYVDKARLIQLVHDNPILWDCRLPNYKRADKSKTEQWNHLGVIFNVSGERVQRTFTSLREIFRRELNNEKLLGRRFKSKWEFYKSMSFLRNVIRERKPRERQAAKVKRQLSPSLNNTLSSSNGIDEYKYFAPNDPNNPSIQQQNQQQPANTNEQQQLPSNDALALAHQNNAQQISVLNLLTQLSNGGNVVVASGSQKNSTLLQTALQQQQDTQQPAQQHVNTEEDDVDLVQPSPATSTAPSMYIKDEIEIPDDDEDDVDEEDSTSITFNGEVLFSNANNKIKTSENDDQRNRSKRKTQLQQWKRNNKSYQADIDDIDDDDDDGSSVQSLPNKNLLNPAAMATGNKQLKSQQQHDLTNMHEHMSSISCVNGVEGSGCVGTTGGVMGGGIVAFGLHNGESEIKYRRHLVYTKFADFIVAKMDAMNEREADDLMDRMMLVIAQKH